MIKPNHIQFDHLQFAIPSPFLTQSRQSDSTIANIHSKKQVNTHKPALAFTNIYFEPNQQGTIQSQVNKRIHGRQTIKKIGQAKLFLAKQRKKQKPQNHSKDSIFKFVKSQIEMSSKQVLKSKNKSHRSSIQDTSVLELNSAIKSIEENRKLTKRTVKSPFERLSIELSSSKYDESKTQICCSVLQLQLKPFQTITNKIEISEQKEKQETGFYKKLKNKIQRAMNKIQQKKTPNKENLLIQGCNSFQSPKPISQKPSFTDRLTPRTSVSRVGLQFKERAYVQKDKRPKTSRASTSERKQIQYLSARSNDLFSDQKRTKRSKRNTISANQKVRQFFIPNTHKTLKHVCPISKQAKYAFSKGQIKQQRMKLKMLNILVDCDNQTEEYQNLQQGLTVFEQYTNRMNRGLLDMSRKLQTNTHMYQYTQF